MLVLYEIKETQEELEQAIQALAENLGKKSTFHLKREWTDHFPGYQAIWSLADIKNEFLKYLRWIFSRKLKILILNFSTERN
jgi:predicted transcriptional regulator